MDKYKIVIKKVNVASVNVSAEERVENAYGESEEAQIIAAKSQEEDVFEDRLVTGETLYKQLVDKLDLVQVINAINAE